jgi:hypothetical protein
MNEAESAMLVFFSLCVISRSQLAVIREHICICYASRHLCGLHYNEAHDWKGDTNSHLILQIDDIEIPSEIHARSRRVGRQILRTSAQRGGHTYECNESHEPQGRSVTPESGICPLMVAAWIRRVVDKEASSQDYLIIDIIGKVVWRKCDIYDAAWQM